MPCTISTERTSSCSDTHLYHTKQLQRDKIKHLLLVELDVGYLVNFLKVYGSYNNPWTLPYGLGVGNNDKV